MKQNNSEIIENSFYLKIYNFFYLAGTLFVRQMRGTFYFVLSKVKDFFISAKESILRLGRKIYISIQKFIIKKKHIISVYSKKISEGNSILKSETTSAKEKRYAFFEIIGSASMIFFSILGSILNYLAPILALSFLLTTLNYFNNLEYGLSYNHNGKALAYIRDQSVYSDAEQIIRNRDFSDSERINTISPSFSVVPVDHEYLTNSEDLANIILENSGMSVYEGYGLYIDGELVGSTDEADNLLLLLDEYREQYREDGDNESKLSFLQKIELLKGVYPTSSIKAISDFKTLFNSEIEGEKYYTVEAGDAPLSIASEFGLTYSELCNMNPGIDSGDIHVGDQVLVSRSVSLLNVTSTRREVYTEDIPFTTNYSYNNNYYKTYSKVTKAGVPGTQEVTALVTYENGVVVGRQILQTNVLTEPVPREVTVGTKNVIYSVGNISGTSHGFMWPCKGGYVTCPFHGYAGHTGMDIGGCGGVGAPIYASAAGKVVTVKYNSRGYGYHIIINHGGGIQTLYAHCSKIYVVPGQYVNQGDLIAAMGRTGNVTGPHLHFEIRINGQYVNPALYVGK